MKFLTAVAACILLMPMMANSAEISRAGIVIKKITPISSVRPYEVGSQKLTRIYFNEAEWSVSGSSCRNNAADILKEDGHILSILLTAWTTGKKISIAVDTTLKPYLGDNTCQIVYISVE